jgi:hypothetical protein
MSGRVREQGGYVAIMAVLIVGAIATAVGLALLNSSVDSQRNASVAQRSYQARGLVHSCAEDALQTIHDNTAYTGTTNLVVSGTLGCSYTVTNTGASTRTVTASATVNSVVRRAEVYVTIGSSSISVTSWKEVN